jgi:hypothetical protein
MKRDVFKFLCGAAAAGSLGHVGYAVATARGTISVPIFRGREWGVGKMLIEAGVYGAISVALGYLGWRSEPRELPRPTSP